MSNASAKKGSSVDPEEIARFEAMSAEWWDASGKFRPLHVFNPARLKLIQNKIRSHFGRETNIDRSLKGIKILDIGCGGGLVAEPLARLGAEVTAIDASAVNIGIAETHARQSGIEIAYRAATAEQLVTEGAVFDVVLTLEVIEHVTSPSAFMQSCGQLVRPGGLLMAATLNRTLKSLALAKIGAEYVLRWLPPGTHDWNKFVTPHDLRRMIEMAELDPEPPVGVSYNPIADRWYPSQDVSVNYMMTATKPA